ncbi:MAG TPA: glycoside hydrolase family 38 C-terminal domain-containing protein [Candidatus Lokiarchaeia archaeon]|nr:glycoside hydrolase family 38 C-terminal domain-containing protein [Candidatus Lokiarchaeia archaeon]
MKHSSRPVIHVIAQSHVDLAWLWRWDPETVEVCCKLTHGMATDNLDQFPEYKFTQSQVPLYQATETHHPEIFEKMRGYIASGRWEIAGGMYVEAEGGEPCGESLVRQCILGKRYFNERFGIDITTCWQEDAWSHPWQLPQILIKCGINAYFHNRGKRTPQMFWWQAPDGSTVLAIKPLHVLHDVGPKFLSWPSVKRWVKKCRSLYGINDVMIRIGKGDHGGGPKPADIETVLSWAKKKDVDVQFDTFQQYKDLVLSRSPALPMLNNELDFMLQGDLTNCGEIKRRNRQDEILLLSAEKISAIAANQGHVTYPKDDLEQAWKRLLFNQFHDIIGGSGIPDACADAHAAYGDIEQSCNDCIDRAMSAIIESIDTFNDDPDAIPVVLFNPLSWTRSNVVEYQITVQNDVEWFSVVDSKGVNIPSQVINLTRNDGCTNATVIFLAKVPALGHAVYFILGSPKKKTLDSSIVISRVDSVSTKPFFLANSMFRLEIDRTTGNISRIIDKARALDLLDASGRGNCLVAIADGGDSEGRFKKHHDVAPRSLGTETDITWNGRPDIKVVEHGQVRGTIEIIKRYKNSTFTQRITLYGFIPVIGFELNVDWHDVHTMIKVAFPLAVKNPIVTYHTAYGTIERPADGCEYPAQYWLDASEKNLGITLFNNARYAHDVNGNVVRMSILRSPTEPAMNTDAGKHVIRYGIITHSGEWKHAGSMQAGYEFNYPLLVKTTTQHEGPLGHTVSYLSVSPSNIMVEVVKQAQDSEDIVLRLFEFEGKFTDAMITGTMLEGRSFFEADMLERPVTHMAIAGDCISLELSPFEIKTILMR